MNPPNWRLTLLGVAIVLAIAAVLPGCSQPAGDALEPQREEAVLPSDRTGHETDDAVVVPPEGADEGHLGEPGNADLTPKRERDPDWDCDPTGNTAIVVGRVAVNVRP